MEETVYPQAGYLRENYRLFRLDGGLAKEVGYHYHDFHKLVFFRSGRAAYTVEGHRYELFPGDCVLVPMGAIHRVEAEVENGYERLILYMSPRWLRERIGYGWNPEELFRAAERSRRYLLRPDRGEDDILWERLLRLEGALADTAEYAAERLADLYMEELLIFLARALRRSGDSKVARGQASKASEVMRYITAHLTEELNIDTLAEVFYVSKYHLMRVFREETGFTIHRYIMDKRLLLARSMLAEGIPAGETCARCGYKDYSAFSRAYRKQFGVSPGGSMEV